MKNITAEMTTPMPAIRFPGVGQTASSPIMSMRMWWRKPCTTLFMKTAIDQIEAKVIAMMPIRLQDCSRTSAGRPRVPMRERVPVEGVTAAAICFMRMLTTGRSYPFEFLEPLPKSVDVPAQDFVPREEFFRTRAVGVGLRLRQFGFDIPQLGLARLELAFGGLALALATLGRVLQGGGARRGSRLLRAAGRGRGGLPAPTWARLRRRGGRDGGGRRGPTRYPAPGRGLGHARG